MKFKNIQSFSHNFSHSFVSDENYVDGKYVIEDFAALAKKANGAVVSIYWIGAPNKPQHAFNQRLQKSIANYKNWLPKHMECHQIEDGAVKELRTDIFLDEDHQIRVISYAKDSNDKEYINELSNFILMEK